MMLNRHGSFSWCSWWPLSMHCCKWWNSMILDDFWWLSLTMLFSTDLFQHFKSTIFRGDHFSSCKIAFSKIKNLKQYRISSNVVQITSNFDAHYLEISMHLIDAQTYFTAQKWMKEERIKRFTNWTESNFSK